LVSAEVLTKRHGWDPHELERMKDNCDKYGVVLEAIRMKSEYINKLRKGPERSVRLTSLSVIFGKQPTSA
jgi:hypothetical protein